MLCFSHIHYSVSYGFVIYSLYYVDIWSFLPNLSKVFIMKECWISSNAFSAIIEKTVILCLILFLCRVLCVLICIYSSNLREKTQLSHGVWSFWCVFEFSLLIFWWILVFVFFRDTGTLFYCFLLVFSGFGNGNVGFIIILENFPSFQFYRIVWKGLVVVLMKVW